MGRIADFLREGAADLFGFGDELELLREQAVDGRMVARALEDLGWSQVGGQTSQSYFDPPREMREKTIERAYRHFFDDVIARRSLILLSNYVFSKGVPIPRYRRVAVPRQNQGDTDLTQTTASDRPDNDPNWERATDLITRFWLDPENQSALTGHRAQTMKHIELQLQGNVFLLMFRQEGQEPVRSLLLQHLDDG